VVDAEDIEQPEKELAMLSLWLFPMPSAGALTRPTLWWAAAQA
jgi:hypothetical protein